MKHAKNTDFRTCFSPKRSVADSLFSCSERRYATRELKNVMHVSTFIDFDRSTLDRFSDFFSLDLCVGLDSRDLALRC